MPISNHQIKEMEELLGEIQADYAVGTVAPVGTIRRKQPNESKAEKKLREDTNKQERALSRQWYKLKGLRLLLQTGSITGGISKRVQEECFTAEMKYLSLEETLRGQKRELLEPLQDSYKEIKDRQEFLQKKLVVLMRYLPYAEGEQKEKVQFMIDSVQNSIKHCMGKIKADLLELKENEDTAETHSEIETECEEARIRKEKYDSLRKKFLQDRAEIIQEYKKERAVSEKTLQDEEIYALKKDKGIGALNNIDLGVLEQCLQEDTEQEMREEELENLSAIIVLRCRKYSSMLTRTMLKPAYVMQNLEEMNELIRGINAYDFMYKICKEYNVGTMVFNSCEQNIRLMRIVAEYAEHIMEGNGFHANYQENSETEQIAASLQSKKVRKQTLENWDKIISATAEEAIQTGSAI